MDQTIKLKVEEWDRVVEILNDFRHPDSKHLVEKIHTQLHYNPADVQPVTQLKVSPEYATRIERIIKGNPPDIERLEVLRTNEGLSFRLKQ